ncbi:MAG: DUF6048 family protein [Bacteroidales bacterium]|jgi:hypothetical protein|nr:DUF6048 family protein [Bacteroidales bacterium]
MRKISGFIISVLLLLPVWCSAQDTIRYPINAMKGIRVGVDISKLLLPVIYSGEQMGFEATADMYIKGNLFGVAEAGWLYVDLNRDAYHYRENGLYGKIGVDYNLLKSRRPYSNDIVYAGVRYGLSVFSQQADQVTIPGYFWPDATGHRIPKSTMQAQWLELLFGVKAEVLKNLYVGLTFRFKFKTVSPGDDDSIPYRIPGYGNGNSGFALGINYQVSYNIRF